MTEVPKSLITQVNVWVLSGEYTTAKFRMIFRMRHAFTLRNYTFADTPVRNMIKFQCEIVFIIIVIHVPYRSFILNIDSEMSDKYQYFSECNRIL